MDSQHRHELQENELAAWLNDVVEKLKPYGSLIAISVVGVVLIYTAWGFYQNSSQASDAAAWNEYTAAMMEREPNLAVLEAASNDLKDAGPVADWSSVTWADGQLWKASTTWLRDSTAAAEPLNEAIEEYERLVLTKGVDATVRQRAQYGLGRAYELQGDLEKALEAYKKVTGPFADLATNRVEAMSDDELRGDFDWLKTAQAPAMTSPLGPGVPGQRPDFAPDSLDDILEEAMGDDGDATAGESLDDILKSIEEENKATEEEATEEEATEEEATEEEATEEEASAEEEAPEEEAPEEEAAAEVTEAEGETEAATEGSESEE